MTHTERTMLDRLHARFGRLHRNGTWQGPRFVTAEHVSRNEGWPSRVADFMAVDTWRSGQWQLHGAEVKVSRSDWLAELRDPSKAQAFTPYVDRWWLVVSHASVARDGELPPTWGLMVASGRGLRVVRDAPVLESLGTPPALLAGFARAVAKRAAAVAK